MIQIGQKCPDFQLPALVGKDVNSVVRLSDFCGKWFLLYFYPLDFTFLCPTEIKAFSDNVPEFEDRECFVLGGSCDSVYSHLGWVNSKEDLRGLKHPLFSDYRKELSSALGVLDHATGAAQRATFLFDPRGICRFIYVTDLNVTRNPAEVLRVLDALQSGELPTCSRKPAPEHAKN